MKTVNTAAVNILQRHPEIVLCLPAVKPCRQGTLAETWLARGEAVMLLPYPTQRTGAAATQCRVGHGA